MDVEYMEIYRTGLITYRVCSIMHMIKIWFVWRGDGDGNRWLVSVRWLCMATSEIAVAASTPRLLMLLHQWRGCQRWWSEIGVTTAAYRANRIDWGLFIRSWTIFLPHCFCVYMCVWRAWADHQWILFRMNRQQTEMRVRYKSICRM